MEDSIEKSSVIRPSTPEMSEKPENADELRLAQMGNYFAYS